jgi:hypothetical protein
MDRCLREIRWEVMPPAQWAEKEGGMRLPFFTDDVTPREFRVRILHCVFILGKHILTCDVAFQNKRLMIHFLALCNLSYQVPTHSTSNTDHPNGALIIAHLRVLAPPPVFPGVTAALTTIIGEEPIDISPTERAWPLDLPGQVALKRHPPLILCVPDVDDEDELQFV